MTFRVWKHTLDITDYQTIMSPEDSVFLSCQITQAEFLSLWFMFNDNNTSVLKEYKVRIAGTGHPIEDVWTNRQYVDTFQVRNGMLVFHVFVRKVE